MHMAAKQNPNSSAPQRRPFSRVSNDSSFFQDLAVPFKKQNPYASREKMLSCLSRNNTLTHHILLGCFFMALQDTDSVFVAHVLYLFHRVVSKFLQGRKRSLLFLEYFMTFAFLIF